MTSPPPHSAKDQLDRIAARAMRERGLVLDLRLQGAELSVLKLHPRAR